MLLSNPPATNTSPFPRRVAVWLSRAVAMLPAEDHVFVAGSYSSAEATSPSGKLSPPATRTLPFPRRVAVWNERSSAMGAATNHLFMAGS